MAIDPTTEPKTRQVTLTGRPPVSIVEAEWPQMAVARGVEGTASVRVRAHRDGRRLVYGAAHRGRGGSRRAGYLLPPERDPRAIVQAITAVAEAIGRPDLGAVCIGALPAEVL